jgi:type IV pilus assembly protein PilM
LTPRGGNVITIAGRLSVYASRRDPPAEFPLTNRRKKRYARGIGVNRARGSAERGGMFGRGKSKALTGLDIGSTSVKAVQLKRVGAGYQLIAAEMEPLPRNLVVDGAVVDAQGVAEKINAVFSAQGISSIGVATSICGHSVIVKRLPMPLMSEMELFDSLPAQAAEHIPFDVSDVSLSYQLLGRNDTELDVLLVAARKDRIQNRMETLVQAGKEGCVLDVDAFALENCFEANYDPHLGELVALLNIGAAVMNINIACDGAPLFTRDVAMGGLDFTEALRKKLDLSFEQAERLKTGGSSADVSEGERNSILKPVSENMVMEVKKTFDFSRATGSGQKISCLFAAGGSARLPGLLDLMHLQLGLPVKELDPFRKILIPPGHPNEAALRDSAAQFAVAVGLGMRTQEAP